MIVLGVILLLVGYLLLPKLTGVPLNVETICVWGGVMPQIKMPAKTDRCLR